VTAFLGPAHGVAYQAAILAGYSEKSARQQSSRLLTKANIQAALKTREQARDDKTIAEADERDRILSSIARDNLADAGDRIRSVVELNRCTGRHSLAVIHKGKLTLEQALSQSREEPPA
jgi:phage terminase small subunit